MKKLKSPTLKFLGLIVLLCSIAVNVVLFFDAEHDISETCANVFKHLSFVTIILGILFIAADFLIEHLSGKSVEYWEEMYNRYFRDK